MTEEQRAEVNELLETYSDVLKNTPGRTTLTEHRIETKDARPIQQVPYRLPHAYKDKVLEELKLMREEGIIKPSVSEWSSPIVCVNKKDGTLRLCVDYRRLNSVSQADAYPMPRIDDLIDRLARVKKSTYIRG